MMAANLQLFLRQGRLAIPRHQALWGHSDLLYRSLTTTEAKTPPVVHVSIKEALSVTTQALRKIGWDESDSKLQAEIMVHAELCGNNQGLVKMFQPELMAPAPDCSKPELVSETSDSVVINANQSPGMLAAVTAADWAVSKLHDDNAIAIASSFNSSTSSGQLAYYVNRMAETGCIGLACCNSPEFVSAAPGGKPVFGTNPLAVGIPVAGTHPFTFDMATSAIALYGVLSAKATGAQLPPNVAFDSHGSWTTDASKVLHGGSIATFGGHKGMGLSLCVELLAGALSGAAVLGQVESKKSAKSWGHTFIAIDHKKLTNDFPIKALSVLKAVKNSGDAIRIPGERSSKLLEERRHAGELPIPEKIWKSLLNTAEHGLPRL